MHIYARLAAVSLDLFDSKSCNRVISLWWVPRTMHAMFFVGLMQIWILSSLQSVTLTDVQLPSSHDIPINSPVSSSNPQKIIRQIHSTPPEIPLKCLYGELCCVTDGCPPCHTELSGKQHFWIPPSKQKSMAIWTSVQWLLNPVGWWLLRGFDYPSYIGDHFIIQ